MSVQERHRRYNQSAKGRARYRRYNRSDKGKARYDAYEDRHIRIRGFDGNTRYVFARTPEAEQLLDDLLLKRLEFLAKQTEERLEFSEQLRVEVGVGSPPHEAGAWSRFWETVEELTATSESDFLALLFDPART